MHAMEASQILKSVHAIPFYGPAITVVALVILYGVRVTFFMKHFFVDFDVLFHVEHSKMRKDA